MRYVNLFWKYFSLNVKGLKSYGTDFYIGIFAMMIKNISSLFLLFFLYTLVPKLDGWSFYEILYLYSLSTMGFAMWRCLFMNTLNISYYVRNGILDRFLVKPINPLFQIFMEGFDDDAWGDLIIGILINIICMYQLQLSWYSLLFSLVLSFFASLIFASFSILGSIISLKTVGVSDFSDIPYLVYEFMKYPITLYGNVLVIIFTYIIPIAWISFIPSRVFIENDFLNSLLLLLMSVGIALLFFSFSCFVFLRYLKSYTSTGT